MTNVIFYDTKSYDKVFFDQLKGEYGVSITYVESRLDATTATMAKGYPVVCAFVNDTVDKEVIGILAKGGVRLLALRCAGYNNVDIKETCGKMQVVRVPAYSPHAVAEHAMALLLAVDRKINHAYVRTREFNFSLEGLVGFDLYGKTIGVIGTGKIGKVFIGICKGFGMRVLAYDLYPDKTLDVEYVSLDTLFKQSDIISLHCPLTKDNRHLLNKSTIAQMKDGAIVINTSRGALIDSNALLDALRSKKLGGAALDVYEEEKDLFYKDNSGEIMEDETLALLITLPNVIVTSHQAFLTSDALFSIAKTTLGNILDWRDGKPLLNGICAECADKLNMPKCTESKK